MQFPQTILLTDVPPGRADTGGVFLRDLCCMIPPEQLSCFLAVRGSSAALRQDLPWLQTIHGSVPPEYGYTRLGGSVNRRTRFVVEWIIEQCRLPRVAAGVLRLAKERSAELVWAPVYSPSGIRIAERVQRGLSAPVHPLVWDPPAYRIRPFRLDPRSSRRVLRSFERLLGSAPRCGVASEPMRRAYEEKYGCPATTLIRGVSRPDGLSAKCSTPGPFTIGVAGRLYATDAWNALLGALNLHNWRVAGKEVVVKILGSDFRYTGSIPVRLEVLGWRDDRETVALLAAMDLAYLPYRFDDDFVEAARLSFPNKLATYVAARVPVLYHGPQQSSPTEFFRRFPVGMGCQSLEPNQILSQLKQALTDGEFRTRAREACDDAYQEELSPAVFRRRFAEFIGVPASLLRRQ